MAVAKLIEINDCIHRTIKRYKLVNKGDIEGASKIPKGTLGTSTGVTKTADNELSLIDFGGDSEPSANTSNNLDGLNEQKQASVEDDLLGLSMSDQNYGQSGGIALGFGANSSKYRPVPIAHVYTNPDFLKQTCQDHRFYRHPPKKALPRRQHQPQL